MDERDQETYPAIREWVIEQQWLNQAQLQRHFNIGWNRVARAVERLEADGVLSEKSADGIRVVLLDRSGQLDPSRLGVLAHTADGELARSEERERASNAKIEEIACRLDDALDAIDHQHAEHTAALESVANQQRSSPAEVTVHIAKAEPDYGAIGLWERRLQSMHAELVSAEKSGIPWIIGKARAEIASAEARLRAAAG